jgi:chemotaxis family two-component system sensor kinase Cph1
VPNPEERERINLSVGDLPDAWADPALIRQVWVNLLSNAVKFSRPRPRGEIKVSASRQDHRIVYHVEDNGVGFDMQYADKLFGVFQRLHSTREFEGTGVGLALVQRIVHRHGGEVWGEGTVDGGATFSFALPEEESHEQR